MSPADCLDVPQGLCAAAVVPEKNSVLPCCLQSGSNAGLTSGMRHMSGSGSPLSHNCSTPQHDTARHTAAVLSMSCMRHAGMLLYGMGQSRVHCCLHAACLLRLRQLLVHNLKPRTCGLFRGGGVRLPLLTNARTPPQCALPPPCSHQELASHTIPPPNPTPVPPPVTLLPLNCCSFMQ